MPLRSDALDALVPCLRCHRGREAFLLVLLDVADLMRELRDAVQVRPEPQQLVDEVGDLGIAGEWLVG